MTTASKRETILVVDDAPATVEAIQRNLTAQGYRVLTASSVAEALRIMEGAPVDLVVTDLKMPKVGGMDLVRHVCENLKDTEIMVITGYPSIEGAVTAVKIGAEEYLAKPFTDGELSAAVDRALVKLHARRLGNAAGQRTPSPHGLIGESAPMRKVFRAIGKAAAGLGHRADIGRKRHGQGACGPGHSLQQQPRRRAACCPSTAAAFPRGCWKASCSAT